MHTFLGQKCLPIWGKFRLGLSPLGVHVLLVAMLT